MCRLSRPIPQIDDDLPDGVLTRSRYCPHCGHEPAVAEVSLVDVVFRNELNRNGGHLLNADRIRPLARPFYDVNRDGYISPIDALQVINHLNRVGDGEGEMTLGDTVGQWWSVAPEATPAARSAGDSTLSGCHGIPRTSGVSPSEAVRLPSPQVGEQPHAAGISNEVGGELNCRSTVDELELILAQIADGMAGEWILDGDLCELLSSSRRR